ncbi:unnamed protein product [Oncorhynchus mykiss]|uniref:NOMO C-terminal transthyretin-like domain-containing protein n=1 Tax=Oncorhynchus mykiss TaxID=8022 RepID=A0A060YPN5_ONCMY|nr:unnamed protein product [Oncorhynchus mykiss]
MCVADSQGSIITAFQRPEALLEIKTFFLYRIHLGGRLSVFSGRLCQNNYKYFTSHPKSFNAFRGICCTPPYIIAQSQLLNPVQTTTAVVSAVPSTRFQVPSVSPSVRPIQMHCINMELGPPFAATTASTLLGRLSTRCWNIAAGTCFHSATSISEVGRIGLARSRCSNSSQRLRSGFYAGQSSSSTPISTNDFCMDLALKTAPDYYSSSTKLYSLHYALGQVVFSWHPPNPDSSAMGKRDSSLQRTRFPCSRVQLWRALHHSSRRSALGMEILGLLHGSVLYFIQLSATGVAEIAESPNLGVSTYFCVYIVYINMFRRSRSTNMGHYHIHNIDFTPQTTGWVCLTSEDGERLGLSYSLNEPDWPRSSGSTYVLMLHSTLSRSQYDFSLPQVSFTSTGYHKHITLTFNPNRKVPDQDVAQGSYIALPLTLLLLLAAYNHEKVIPLLLQLVSRLQGVRSLSQAGGDNAALDEAKRQAKRQKTRRT